MTQQIEPMGDPTDNTNTARVNSLRLGIVHTNDDYSRSMRQLIRWNKEVLTPPLLAFSTLGLS